MKPFIFERQIFVLLVHLAVKKHILHRVGIDAPLRTLIDAAGVKQRRLVIPARRISRKNYRIFLERDFVRENGQTGKSGRKKYRQIFHTLYYNI